MAQTVVGIFDSTSEAQNAIDQLLNSGFTRSDIDMAARTDSTSSTTTGSTTGSTYDRDRDDDSFGSGISRFFSSLFDSDDEVNNYSSVAKRGCTVTVHVDSMQEAERAADILDQYGAVDVNERAGQFGSTGYSGATTGFADTTTARTTSDDNDASLKVIEENLQVGKRVVETGGARLRSRIVEKPVEESLRLRVEHVHVNRTPVNRPATEADLNNFQGGVIEVTESAEVPVVHKEARVVEEVSLSKDVEEREEVIRDTVRRTDVEVENLQRGTDMYNTTTNRSLDADDLDDLNRPSNR